MEKETIEKLKELKQLLDEGILTQEEFDTEKQKLLASSPTVIPKAETLVLETEETPVSIREYDTQNRFESQIKPNRTIHIPLLHRSVVINATSPQAVINKCNNYINNLVYRQTKLLKYCQFLLFMRFDILCPLNIAICCICKIT